MERSGIEHDLCLHDGGFEQTKIPAAGVASVSHSLLCMDFKDMRNRKEFDIHRLLGKSLVIVAEYPVGLRRFFHHREISLQCLLHPQFDKNPECIRLL